MATTTSLFLSIDEDQIGDTERNHTTEQVAAERHGAHHRQDAALGADTVRGVTQAPPYTYTFNTPFAVAPTVAVVTMAAVDGGNGGWAYTFGPSPTSTTSLDLVIDEDTIGDTERNHTTEQVGYVVFASPGSASP